MVLHHVAQRAGGVVVAAARADAERLGDGDLDVVDDGRSSTAARRGRCRSAAPSGSAPSPCRDSGRCGKSGLRAKTAPTASFTARAEARSWPTGFSMTTRVYGVTRPCRPMRRQIVVEEVGADGEIEGADLVLAVRQELAQAGPSRPRRSRRRRHSESMPRKRSMTAASRSAAGRNCSSASRVMRAVGVVRHLARARRR